MPGSGALLAGVWMAAAAAATEPLIEVRSRDLAVAAPTVDTLLTALQAHELLQAHAMTRSVLNLRMELEAGSSSGDESGDAQGAVKPSRSCRLQHFEVHLEVEVVLPAWKPTLEPTDAERALWRAIRARLEAHEQRHRSHSEAAARRLHQRLRQRLGQHVSQSCQSLQVELDSMRQSELERVRLRDQLLDQTDARTLRFDRPAGSTRRRDQ